MRIVVAMMLLVGTHAAMADEIGEAALRCWNPAPAANTDSIDVEFDVRLDADGNVDDLAVVLPTDHSEEDVRAAALAIQRCAPYQPAGQTVRARLIFEDDGPIDPFKPLD